ncbi:MAG: uracil-DNA glycosylase [Treponema sp.]|nr:uracil-DNA glycosylase [Treponema sp.]
MTATEKKNIYNFLKASISAAAGYRVTEFKMDENLFQDDRIASSEETIEEKDSTVEQKDASAGITLAALREKIARCHACTLSKSRTNTVCGEGVENPAVLVVGEGPGEEEDKTGRPFVGKAGCLLDKMLSAISLSRSSNCYIANIVKCRPPHNRTPEPQEADSCSGYLQAQIHLLKPKAILAMGRCAVQNLLHTSEGINSLRGKMFDLNGIPLMATYHPSALLRDETLKRPAWEDLKTFRMKLKEICPEYDKPFAADGAQG